MAPAANSGHIADLSDGNALTLAFFDGFPGPLTPRAGYAFRLAFRSDGQPCRELNAPQPMSAAPGQADPTFDLRTTRQSLKSGNVLPWTQPEVNDQLLWTSVNAVGIDQTAGCNNSPGVWMGWPNPVFTQSIPCEHLQANKTYRLAFQLRSNLSNDPTIKAWSDKLLTVHPHLRHATPFTATLDYFDNTGNKKSIRNEWSLPKQHDWTSFDMTITVPEDAFAPSLRFEATPEYAGEIFLDDITFDPIE